MKKLVLTVTMVSGFITLFTASFATAQSIDRTKLEQQLEEVVARLNLTDEQRSIVRPVIEQGVRERASILKDAGIEMGSKPSMRQLLKVRGPLRKSRKHNWLRCYLRSK